MDKEKTGLTFKEEYDQLSTSDKIKVRTAFLLKFEYQYPTFYQKLKQDRFKKIELEYLFNLLPATNQNI